VAEEVNAERRDVKIGEMLVAVGVVTSGDLQEAIQIAKRMNLPIGRVIVMSGVITEGNLQYALEAQSLIKDGLLDYDTAISALYNAYSSQRSLQDALVDLRWAPRKDVSSNKLGELLMDSNMVTQAQLDLALQTSFESGMPLGGTLVLQGVLSAQLLPMVLNAQEHIREGKVTRNQAVENLKAALMFWATAESSQQKDAGNNLFEYGHKKTSGLLTNSLMESFQPPDAALVNSPERSNATTANIGAQNISAAPASEAAQSVASLTPSKNMGLVEMMQMAGYCTRPDIDAAIERALASSEIAAKLFLATGLLTQTNLDNFLRCRALLVKGALRPEQAIYALSACRIRAVNLSDVFNEMGIKT
jgi:hypothetical protein